MCSSPVLAAPDFTKPFKLEVDASGTGAGAVRLQEDDYGIDHPICFYSQKFNRHQLNYCTIEKEALSLLLALQQFKVYIGFSSQPVEVFTDHNSLVFLHRICNKNQRLMRWALICQSLIYKSDTRKVLIMSLSRCYV